MRRPLALISVLAAAIGLAACTPLEKPPIPRDEAVRQLMARPDLDEAVRTYERLLADLAHRLTAAGLTGEWRWAIQRTETSCYSADFDRHDGHLNAGTAALHWWRTAPQITPENWDAALALVTKFAASKGFNDVDVFHDKPGDRIVDITGGPYSAMLDFRSTPTESVLGAVTGCHRLADVPLDPNPQPSRFVTALGHEEAVGAAAPVVLNQ